MSQEYIIALALLVGSILKIFGIELENKTLESVIASVATLWIAIRRYQKGDINIVGAKK